MKRMITVLFFLLFLPAFIHAGTVGKIKGKVTDLQSGEPLIGANVIVVGTSNGAASDVKGEFVINNLNAGTYTLKASYIGYQTITVSNVRVNSELTTEMNFQLPAEGISTKEINIIAQKPLVEPSNTNAIRNTTSDDFNKLPVRGINSILALTPGVNLQDNNIYVRGGRQDEVGFYLEGTNITNPLVGGREVGISQDAIEEIQVQAGGYTAEFGGANAGIVRQQLKTGGPEFKLSAEYITDNLALQSSNDRFNGKQKLGSYWWGYSDFTGTVSGPILGNTIKFFGLFNSNFQNDVNPQPFPGINLGWIRDPNAPIKGDSVNFNYPAGPTYKNSAQTYEGTGTLTFDLNPIQIRLTGTYSSVSGFGGSTVGNLFDILDLNRIQVDDQKNGSFNLKLTHIINPSTYYELSGGYTFNYNHNYDPYLVDNFVGYGDSVANTAAGVPWARRPGDHTGDVNGRYNQPTNYSVYNFSFDAPNSVSSTYLKRNQETFNFAGAFSTDLSKENNLKIGGELQMYKIRNYSFNNAGVISLAGQIYTNDTMAATNPHKTSREAVYIKQGVNNYGYDVFGNEYNGADNFATGSLAPKKPVIAGIYVQDKLEYKNLIVNAGLRWDYINIDNYAFKDPSRPQDAMDYTTGAINPDGLVKVPSFQSLSPRLGFSFPITDQTIFHAQYGKFVQQSRLRDVYQGLYATHINIKGGLFISNPVGFNIRPTRTTQYEIGFTQQIANFASFDVTGYYKDIQDQIVVALQQITGQTQYQDYNIYTNGDFATTKGVEVAFNMRRVERIQVNGSVSFQDARGTGSFPSSDAGIVGAPIDGKTIFKPVYVDPLIFNNAFRGNISFDYRFGKDDGPSALQQLGLNALLTFTGGHPFTLGAGKGDVNGALEGDARFRSPTEPLNSSTTPGTFQVDLRLDKTITIYDKLSANIYFLVINVFDAKNVENVFLRTGNASDDGYLSDPNLGGQLATKNGAKYSELYKALNIDYYQAYQIAGGIQQGFGSALMYGPPREIRFGIRLEY
ncbi:MAG: TonB-dependent receptor [Ignavibacteriaceae bacterium]|nr:TonB-dependent receptor [Ignavibacteriaceae bacterium]